MKPSLQFIALSVVIAILCIAGPKGCTRPAEATRILQQQGYTDIEITGWRPMMAGEDDTFSTGFKAKSQSGDTVTGAVTSGAFKGSTIRLD